jgi:hypothetical protein
MTPVRSTVNRDPEFLKKPGGELTKIWDDYDFLWFPVNNQETSTHFQKKFGTIKYRLMKVIKKEDHISISGVPISP